MTCSGPQVQVTIAHSSMGSIVPPEHAHAWCAKHAFWEDPTRQCVHIRALKFPNEMVKLLRGGVN